MFQFFVQLLQTVQQVLVLVMHQEQNPEKHMTIDSIREFRELTEIKLQSKQSGLLMIGGGVPKNFIQDTVVCAELLGKKVDMHKYAFKLLLQILVMELVVVQL